MYDPAKLTIPPDWRESAAKRRPQTSDHSSAPAEGSREEIATYYASITAVDEQIGRVLDALRDAGMDKNTIVLVTSDHGDMLNTHGMRNKRKPYDESARVPGLLCWPGQVRAGRTVETLFSHIDMPPTLLALCRLPVPAYMQGAELSKVALGRTTKEPDAVFRQIFMPFLGDNVTQRWRGVITDRYTYSRYQDSPWLFDHLADPYEVHNLAQDPAFASLRHDLDHNVEAFMTEFKDSWSVGSTQELEPTGVFVRHVYRSLEEYFDATKTSGTPSVARP
jgi:arylsulfatase A-like enzyme